MIGLDALFELLHFGAGLALFVIGVVTAWGAGASAKRLIGLAIMSLGSVLALAALGAPQGLIVAAVLAGLAYIVVGTALMVRLQEAYGGVEAAMFDRADRESEPDGVEP